MDIYTLIRKDHDDAKAVIEKIKKLSDAKHEERMALFRPLKVDLLTHNEAEEESFYAALEEHDKTVADAEESEDEHHEAADLLAYLDDDELEAKEWSMKFHQLCTALLDHITKEEGKIFREAKTVLSGESAEKLAALMQDLKQKKKAVLKEEALQAAK
jgi:hemerythrin superfamily protein